MKDALRIALGVIPWLISLYFLVRAIRSWRRHRRFMLLMKEVDRSTDALHTSKTVAQLKARCERINELLEHARAVNKRK